MPLVELIRITTSDGIRLDGALASPKHPPPANAIEAFLLLHGVGGNFYSGTMFEVLSETLLDLGAVVLRVNTRGHGSVSSLATATGPVRGGAAYEVVDDCRRDIEAWVSFLAERGHSRIGLLGHSLGAVKAIYSQAVQPQACVRGLVAVSPPRLSRNAFQAGPRSPEFLTSLTEATQCVSAGRPETLINVPFPHPLLISASSYVDKYAEERYNVVRLIDRLRCPVLFTFGSIELEQGGVAFAGMPDAILAAATDAQHLQVETLPEADHFYTGQHAALARRIGDWVRELRAAA